MPGVRAVLAAWQSLCGLNAANKRASDHYRKTPSDRCRGTYFGETRTMRCRSSIRPSGQGGGECVMCFYIGTQAGIAQQHENKQCPRSSHWPIRVTAYSVSLIASPLPSVVRRRVPHVALQDCSLALSSDGRCVTEPARGEGAGREIAGHR